MKNKEERKILGHGKRDKERNNIFEIIKNKVAVSERRNVKWVSEK